MYFKFNLQHFVEQIITAETVAVGRNNCEVNNYDN